MGKIILGVDDSASVRQMVQFTLEKAGYDVILAVDGLDALDKAKQCQVDMVITDLHMPNVNGIELIRMLRADPAFKYTPIIMLTTENSMEKKNTGRNSGATGWIVKPFKPEQLIAVVKRIIG
jgi:two-component system, chemotaxis family, chemotaxis protein CheY